MKSCAACERLQCKRKGGARLYGAYSLAGEPQPKRSRQCRTVALSRAVRKLREKAER